MFAACRDLSRTYSPAALNPLASTLVNPLFAQYVRDTTRLVEGVAGEVARTLVGRMPAGTEIHMGVAPSELGGAEVDPLEIVAVAVAANVFERVGVAARPQSATRARRRCGALHAA